MSEVALLMQDISNFTKIQNSLLSGNFLNVLTCVVKFPMKQRNFYRQNL